MKAPRATLTAPRVNAHTDDPDLRIAKKIVAGQSVVFRDRFPSQVEQCLRLLTERLQAGLDKRNGVVLDNTTTWNMTALELSDLARAVECLYNVYNNINNAGNLNKEQNNDRPWDFDEASDPLGLRK